MRGRYPFSRAGPQVGRVALLCLLPGAGWAQAAPAYHPLQLDCGVYRQQVRSEIRLAAGRTRSRETTGRDGTLVLHAAASDSTISLEAWFDTLDVWREGSGVRIAPETDGVIGGRFKGILTRTGGFTSVDRPFIPDDVAQVADVGDALQELLPPLPPVPLKPGAAWRDDFGTVITRLPDGTSAGRPVQRFRLVRMSDALETRYLPDSTEVRANRHQSESGVYEWSSELGVVRWEREISIDVTVPAGGPVKTPFRTNIVQEASVVRLPTGCEP
jgi:hypothetical protein